MAMTDIIICNMALSKAGITQPITSLSGTDVRSIQCNLYYANTRDEVLREYEWPFAVRVEEMCEVSTAEYNGWDYVYEYPENALKLTRIYSSGVGKSLHEYRVISQYDGDGKWVLTNLGDAWCEYIMQITDCDQFTPDFIDALSTLLASKLVIALESDYKRQSNLMQLYQFSLDKAKLNAAREGYVEPYVYNAFKSARN